MREDGAKKSSTSKTSGKAAGNVTKEAINKSTPKIKSSDSEVPLEKEVKQEVVRKVSTGCGPSPPREIGEQPETVDDHPAEEIELEKEDALELPVRKISTSVGTSPPPQCAGTQVRCATIIFYGH